MPTQYFDSHHAYTGHYRTSPYKENCVGYGDGHAETHRHKFDDSLGWPYWDGEYVVAHNAGYLY